MNGMFLTIVGLFFNRVTLSVLQARVCRGALLYSVFANWFFATLAGIAQGHVPPPERQALAAIQPSGWLPTAIRR